MASDAEYILRLILQIVSLIPRARTTPRMSNLTNLRLRSILLRLSPINRTSRHNTSLVVIRMPEILLTPGCTLEPRWEDAARKFVRPELLVFLVFGFDAFAGDLLDDPDARVEEDVGADACDETVGDAVGEGHDGDLQNR